MRIVVRASLCSKTKRDILPGEEIAQLERKLHSSISVFNRFQGQMLLVLCHAIALFAPWCR
jgi:hypothetical protein